MTKHPQRSHDSLFKELISSFLEEFVLAFFPEVYEEIDFRKTTLLPTEHITDMIDGNVYRVDLLFKTTLKYEDAFIIIHIEPQSSYKKGFQERMFRYFSLLYEKHRKHVIPIAIFSYNKMKKEETTFSIKFPFLSVLHFEFLALQLRRENWRSYLKQPNPVTAALLSKMGYKHKEKVEVKKEFLRMLVKLQITEAQTRLVTRFFESYLILNSEEEKKLLKEIPLLEKKEAKKIMELTTSWERKGMEKGKLQGKMEGRLEGRLEGKLEEKRNLAKKLLIDGFPLTKVAELTELSEEQMTEITK